MAVGASDATASIAAAESQPAFRTTDPRRVRWVVREAIIDVVPELRDEWMMVMMASRRIETLPE